MVAKIKGGQENCNYLYRGQKESLGDCTTLIVNIYSAILFFMLNTNFPDASRYLSHFYFIFLFFFVDEHKHNEICTQLILNKTMLTHQDLEGREHLHQAY